MFWRRNKQAGPVANRLRNEARPNELTAETGRANELGGEAGDLYDVDAEDADQEGDLESDEEEIDASYRDADEDETEEADLEERARRTADLRAELEREAEEFGLTETNSAEFYGPNGEEVSRFLDRLGDVDDDELEERYDAWRSRPRDEKKLVDMAVRAVERSSDLRGEIEAARTAVSQWADFRVRLAAEQGDDGDEFYRAMARAMSDGAVALVLRDELEAVDFESLGGPWAEEIASRSAGHKAAAKKVAPKVGSEPIEEEGEFGPNTEEVTALLNRLESLTPQEIARLTATWRDQPKGGLREAHRDMEELVDEDPRWGDQIARAQDVVTVWVNEEAPGSGAAFGRPADFVRPAAAPAIADAVAAFVLADLLEPENAELLYAPWQRVIGSPELPLPGDDEGGEDGGAEGEEDQGAEDR